MILRNYIGRRSIVSRRTMGCVMNSDTHKHTYKVEHIFQIQCLTLYYNVINERTPDFFSKMFKLKSRMHSHETRQNNYIHIAGTRTTSAKQCIRQYIPTVLTSIPTLVSDKITTHSYAGFSRYAKQYFIQLYKYECVISNCYKCSNAT